MAYWVPPVSQDRACFGWRHDCCSMVGSAYLSHSFLEFTITYYYAQEYGHRYPTWALLACNYLAVMASSMSSEQAFSVASITISKCRNQLKGDIVKALQCLKCLYHQDLIFCEVITCSEEEDVLDEVLPEISDSSDEFAWDQILLNDEDLD